jgi:hypothetical protein
MVKGQAFSGNVQPLPNLPNFTAIDRRLAIQSLKAGNRIAWSSFPIGGGQRYGSQTAENL